MGRRSVSFVAMLALVAGVIVLPVSTAGAAEPPETVQITDPKGDANAINDQDNAYGTPVAGQGDYNQADVGTATDILRVWFANTATEISLNIELEGDPSNLAYDTYFRFSSNTGEGSVAADTTRGCLQWIASVNGAAGAYSGPTEGELTDKCNVGTPVKGKLEIAQAGDASYVLTVTFPRDYSPLLADGKTITAPFGVSRIVYVNGIPPNPGTPSGVATGVTLDNTKRGTDYTITGGTPEEPPVITTPDKPKPAAPGKGDPPGKGKKKGCDNGKGKKKGACPAPVTASCAPYTPGQEGTGAQTTVITDAATAEAPVVLEFDAEAGLGAMPIGGTPVPYDETTRVFHNIQVDSANPSVGVYAKLEFPEYHDYDLYLNHPDGSAAGYAGDANAAPGHGLGSGTEGGSESGTDYEAVLGLGTPDCGGYTAEMVSFLSTGGTMKLSLWLGEIKAEAAAPEGQQQDMMSMFYNLMGL